MDPQSSEEKQDSSVQEQVSPNTTTVPPTKKVRHSLLALAILVLVAIAIGTILYYRDHHKAPSSDGPKISLQSESQALQQEVDQLKADAPAADADLKKKLKYYDELFYTQSNAGNYDAALKTFETRQSLSKDDVDYGEYFYAAQDYCKVKNKDGARQAIAGLRDAMPAQDDPDNGYRRADLLNTIDFMSKECGL